MDLVHPEPPKSPPENVIGVSGNAFDTHVRPDIRTACKNDSLLKNIGAPTFIGTCVAYQSRLQSKELTFSRNPCLIVHLERVLLGAHSEGFTSIQRHLERSLCQKGSQAEQNLNGYIELSSKGASDRKPPHSYLILRKVQAPGYLPSHEKGALGGTPYIYSAVLCYPGHAGLRLEITMLDERRFVILFDDQRGFGEGIRGISLFVDDFLQDVSLIMDGGKSVRLIASSGEAITGSSERSTVIDRTASRAISSVSAITSAMGSPTKRILSSAKTG